MFIKLHKLCKDKCWKQNLYFGVSLGEKLLKYKADL